MIDQIRYDHSLAEQEEARSQVIAEYIDYLLAAPKGDTEAEELACDVINARDEAMMAEKQGLLPH